MIKLCVKELCMTVVCDKVVCVCDRERVTKLGVKEAGVGGGGMQNKNKQKTRTPHKVAGENYLQQDY